MSPKLGSSALAGHIAVCTYNGSARSQGATCTDVTRYSKLHPRTGHEGPGGAAELYIVNLSLTSGLDRSRWSTPRPGRFTPGRDPVPIVQKAGWAPGPVWMGAENLVPTGFDPRTVQPVGITTLTELSRAILPSHESFVSQLRITAFCPYNV